MKLGMLGRWFYGIRFSRNVVVRLKMMKYGLIGCRMYCGWFIVGFLIVW